MPENTCQTRDRYLLLPWTTRAGAGRHLSCVTAPGWPGGLDVAGAVTASIWGLGVVLGQDTLVLREHQAWLWCSSPHAAFVCNHPQKEGRRPFPKSSKARESESCLHHTKSKSSLSWTKQSLEITFFAHWKSLCPSTDCSGNPCSQGRWADPRPPEGHKAPGVFARQRAKWVLKSGLYYSSIPISSSISGGKIRPLIYFANVLLGMTPHPAAGGGCGKQGFF